MLYIETNSMDAAFNFAVEEFCMEHFPEDEWIWMLWRTDKCVMLGSNQIADMEIDRQMAEQLGVRVVRRSSGGGTIYTDPGTLQYTVIVPHHMEQDVKQVEREILAGSLLRGLNKLNIPALLEGRNDITLEGRKISGLAQYMQKNRLCSHGSLLYDTDLDILSKVLRPDEEKIRAKAIRSVRSRVTTLTQYMENPLPILEFMDLLKTDWLQSQNMREYTLTADDIASINEIRNKKYDNPIWNYGRTPRFSYHNEIRFPAGKIEVFLEVEKGIIKDCKICGDFLGVLPPGELEEKLQGIDYQYHTVEALLSQINLGYFLGGITQEQLLACLFR